MSKQPYPEGIDCSWLASDRDGHLGVFITAGVGPIPASILDFSDVPICDIEERLCQLPPVSQVQLLVSVKRPDDFVDLAERGFYVYDWTDSYRTHATLNVYELVAVPSKPINASSLPSDLAALAKMLKLTNVTFAAGDAVDIRAHVRCTCANAN